MTTELEEAVARAICNAWACEPDADLGCVPLVCTYPKCECRESTGSAARSAIAIVVARCERLATDHWHFADVRDEGELAPIITICQEISASIRALICPSPSGLVDGTQQEPTSGTTGQAGSAVAVLPAIPGGENP